MTTPDVATSRAEAIASQVVDLKDTELLVLRCPPDMDTLGDVFERFRKELLRLLPPDVGTVRAIVLRSDMELDSYTAEELNQVGLWSDKSHVGPMPEEMFEDGALLAAARAGWQAARGIDSSSQQHIAKESLRLLKQDARLQIEYSCVPAQPVRLGQCLLYGWEDPS